MSAASSSSASPLSERMKRVKILVKINYMLISLSISYTCQGEVTVSNFFDPALYLGTSFDHEADSVRVHVYCRSLPVVTCCVELH